jgi:hypothetical protein
MRQRRLRGTGSIYLNKGSRFWWIAYFGKDGKRHHETSGSIRKTDASKLLNQRLGEVQLTAVFVQGTVKLCDACRRIFESDHVQADHRIPKSRGGTNDPMNFHDLCMKCHRKKTGLEKTLSTGTGSTSQFEQWYALAFPSAPKSVDRQAEDSWENHKGEANDRTADTAVTRAIREDAQASERNLGRTGA